MTNTANSGTYTDWIDADVYDSAGDKIGSIEQIYVDDHSGQPEWLTVSTGWFGTSTQFVPIAGSSTHEGGLKVPYTTDHIKEAPSIDDDAHLDADDERRLYDHYGMSYDSADHEETYGGRERADEGFEYADTRTGRDTDVDPRTVDADAVGTRTADTGGDADAVGTRTGDAGSDAEVTLSEEQLEVDKVEREAGRARLRKYTVTEDVNVTVPVKKQVARIVRTDATGTEAGSIGDGEQVEEIVLTEEEVTVDKNVVAKENVRLETETVTEQREVSDTVRREEVEVDGDIEDTTTNR